jgi:hypothetical protein
MDILFSDYLLNGVKLIIVAKRTKKVSLHWQITVHPMFWGK